MYYAISEPLTNNDRKHAISAIFISVFFDGWSVDNHC